MLTKSFILDAINRLTALIILSNYTNDTKHSDGNGLGFHLRCFSTHQSVFFSIWNSFMTNISLYNMFGNNMGIICLLQRAASPTYIQEQKELQER